ncbi:hypothetical protein EW145_g1529 [Phellinidium pouzarii]|uniref:Uncharacterized protein n=1 Tax=Phellinidium pouzarii TaxID=167371 RepID=A0A4S4LJS0_9AGAM|nr:hypothetical protein EW145_g1529 [Phellinidium pouzarii]
MSPQPTTSEESQKRPGPHLSVASVDSNASGVADSTISYATDWTVSHFPTPPSEIPTPTQSNFDSPATPGSSIFVEHFAPSVSDYSSSGQLGTLQISSSPSDLPVRVTSKGQDSRSALSDSSSVTERMDIPHVRPLNIRRPGMSIERILSHSTSTTTSTIQSASYRRDVSHPPPVISAVPQRPASPRSLTGASSLFDWSDTGSGISVNTSEERLLSTSFITSLLSQSPEPFPRKRVVDSPSRLAKTVDNDMSALQINRDVASPKRGSVHGTGSGSSHHLHQSVSSSPFDLHSVRKATKLRSHLTPTTDEQSFQKSTEYMENSDASEGQSHSVIRSPSLSSGHEGSSIHPLKFMVPAYHVSYGTQRQPSGRADSTATSNNSMVTAALIPFNPPIHHADTPRSVHHMSRVDAGGTLRESEEDYARLDAVDLDMSHLELPLSPALPSTAGLHYKFADVSTGSDPAGHVLRQSLQRNQSRKSVVSSIISRVSNKSAAQKAKYMTWLRKRPLPQIPPMANPPPEIPDGREIQKAEENIPLPMLAKRAEELQGILTNGRLSARDNQFRYKESSGQDTFLYASDRDTYLQINKTTGSGNARSSQFSRFRGLKEDTNGLTQSSPKNFTIGLKMKKRRLWTIVGCVLVGVILAAAIPIAITSRKKGSGPSVCSGNFTGAACTLDATCECTTSTGTCKPLALSLSLLVPDVNSLFAVNFTASKLSDTVVGVVGPPSGGLCQSQALLIDVEPGLDSASAPNRTRWAQSAILWNLGLSEDVNATTNLQRSVSTAPWNILTVRDGPVKDTTGKFAFDASGFTFDFASQTLAPMGASFEEEGDPSDAQLAEVSETAGKALDRMYSFAVASSNQRKKALTNYWTSVLQQQETNLAVFIEAVRSSPFLIPFDVTSSPGGNALTSLMSNTSTTPFPPPIACYPGLNSTQVARINSLEVLVFNLTAISQSPSEFSISCFPDRPVYGVVDLLQLRLPFPDSRKGVALQAAALSRDATVRTIVYSGEMLSALPGATVLPGVEASATDSREFGASNFLNHVLLNYLSSISNITLAMDLISHVLSSSTPPANNSDLANSLSVLPVLEFAFFGSITPQDIASSVTSFSTQSDSLFFGSNAGQTFRSWALVNASASIAWTESAVSLEICRENATTDSRFESIWKPASELIAEGTTDATDVQDVTTSLNSFNMFSFT